MLGTVELLERAVVDVSKVSDVDELVEGAFLKTAEILRSCPERTCAAVDADEGSDRVGGLGLSSALFATFCAEMTKVVLERAAVCMDKVFAALQRKEKQRFDANADLCYCALIGALFEQLQSWTPAELQRSRNSAYRCELVGTVSMSFATRLLSAFSVVTRNQTDLFDALFVSRFISSAGFATEWGGEVLLLVDDHFLLSLLKLIHASAEPDGLQTLHTELMHVVVAIHVQIELALECSASSSHAFIRVLKSDLELAQQFFASLLFYFNRVSEHADNVHLALLRLLGHILKDPLLSQQFYANDVSVMVDICLNQLSRQSDLGLLQGYLRLLPGIIVNCDYRSITVKSAGPTSPASEEFCPAVTSTPLAVPLTAPKRKPPLPPPRRTKSPVARQSSILLPKPPTRDEMSSAYKSQQLSKALNQLLQDPNVQSCLKTTVYIRRIQFQCNLKE